MANSTIKSQYWNATTIANTLTDVTSGGTVTTSPNFGQFSFIAIVFINAATDSSGARGVLLVPTKTIGYYAFFPVVVGGVSGYVRLAVNSGELQVVSQSGYTTLKVLYVFGLN